MYYDVVLHWQNLTVSISKRKKIELRGCHMRRLAGGKKAISGVRKVGTKSAFRIEICQKRPDKNWGLSDKGSKGIFGGPAA